MGDCFDFNFFYRSTLKKIRGCAKPKKRVSGFFSSVVSAVNYFIAAIRALDGTDSSNFN